MFDFPPIPFVKQLCIHYPEAIHTYTLLWDQKDNEGFVIVKKSKISLEYLVTPSKFQRYLMLLCREGLVNVIHDEDNEYELELVQWGEDFEEAL